MALTQRTLVIWPRLGDPLQGVHTFNAIALRNTPLPFQIRLLLLDQLRTMSDPLALLHKPRLPLNVASSTKGLFLFCVFLPTAGMFTMYLLRR